MAMNTTPFIMDKPTINITAGPIALVCVARRLALTPEDAEVDVATFCDPQGVEFGATKWTMEVEALQNFDSAADAGDGLWNQLHALRKTTVSAELLPQDGVAVSTANPSATCNIRIPSIPFLNATPGEKTLMPLVFPVVGEPTFAFA